MRPSRPFQVRTCSVSQPGPADPEHYILGTRASLLGAPSIASLAPVLRAKDTSRISGDSLLVGFFGDFGCGRCLARRIGSPKSFIGEQQEDQEGRLTLGFPDWETTWDLCIFCPKGLPSPQVLEVLRGVQRHLYPRRRQWSCLGRGWPLTAWARRPSCETVPAWRRRWRGLEINREIEGTG